MFEFEYGGARIQIPPSVIVKNFLNTLQKPCESTAPVQTRGDAPPPIGTLWHCQGGVYAGLMRGENGAPDYHLIVPSDAKAEVAEITWGGRGKEEPGAQSTFDGLANTTALCASKNDHPAAQWAADLSIDGFTDFYLPSRRELRLCWVNVPELFEDGAYWTSTQSSAYDAWFQDFGGGGQYDVGKSIKLRARAVRRFIDHSSI